MAEVEVQNSPDPGSSSSSSSSSQFPVGLRILLVDNDSTSSTIMKMMLKKCRYKVTCCTRAKKALSLLQRNKGSFDIVLTNVHMPEMNGFDLLKIVVLEMDIPVVMVSCDAKDDVVMRAIKQGACDYLVKPARMEELRNIWQHVLRKKEQIAANATRLGTSNAHKNKRDGKETDTDETDSDDTLIKKPRVSWNTDLHQKFINAINQLGIDKAVPKRILELMEVPNITREHVASHLQKFRGCLKKLTGIDRTGQIPPEIMAFLSAQMLGPATSFGGKIKSRKVSKMLLPFLQQQQPQSLVQESPHALNMQPSSLISNLPPNTFQAGNDPFLMNQNNTLVVQAGNNHLLMNPNSITTPSQSLICFQAGRNPVIMNQNSGGIPAQPLAFGNWAGDNPTLMSQAENSPIPIDQSSNYIVSSGMGQISAEDFNNVGMMNNCSVHGLVPSPVSYISPVGMAGPNLGNNHNSGMAMEALSDRGQGINVGFVDQGTCIAIDGEGQIKNNSSDDEDVLAEDFLLDILDSPTDEDSVLPDFPK